MDPSKVSNRKKPGEQPTRTLGTPCAACGPVGWVGTGGMGTWGSGYGYRYGYSTVVPVRVWVQYSEASTGKHGQLRPVRVNTVN